MIFNLRAILSTLAERDAEWLVSDIPCQACAWNVFLLGSVERAF